MKLNELLENAYDDAADDSMSPHAKGNLSMALGDMAMQEFMKMEQDPAGYFEQRGERIAPEQAQQIAQTLSSVDDKTFDLMGNSPMVQRAIEANYDNESDSSFIDLATMTDILSKVQARMGR